MARISYRRTRRLRLLIKLIVVLLVVLIGIPLLIVRVIKLPRIGSEVPIINVWNTKIDSLMTMSLEEYVQGVVAAEMPASFHIEALKAQAVVARTYAMQRIENDVRIPDHPEAHLSTDYQSGQAWVSHADFKARCGLVEYHINQRRIKKAVSDTHGIVAVYNGRPILAVYHSTSGGRTENSEHYWNDALPYLRSVDDPYGSHSPFQYSSSTFTYTEFLRLMEIDKIGNVKVIERYPSGRVKTMEAGDTWFSGRDVRQRLGLRSSWFTVSVTSNTIEFSVWGYGHGVGMPQYGADGMAQDGYDYRRILQYYYQGISLEQFY